MTKVAKPHTGRSDTLHLPSWAWPSPYDYVRYVQDRILVLLILAAMNPAQAQEAIQEKQDQPPTLIMSGTADSVMIFGIKYRGIRVGHLGNSELARGAGLAPGDVLFSLNGRPVLSLEDIDRILSASTSTEIELSFARQVNGTYKLIDNKARFQNPNKNRLKAIEIFPLASSLTAEDLTVRIVELINIDRAQEAKRNHLAPLQLDQTLSKVAREHAEDMVKRNFFSHVNPEGQGPQERLRKAGINSPLAENILSGALTPEEAHDELMNEPSDDPHNHRGNILNQEFHYVGVGIARNPDQTLVLVETFAKAVPHTKDLTQGRTQH